MKDKFTRFLLSFFLALALYCACAVNASADDQVDAEALHVAVDGSGAYLFSIHGVLSEGDEYIADDNVLYRIAIESTFVPHIFLQHAVSCLAERCVESV